MRKSNLYIYETKLRGTWKGKKGRREMTNKFVIAKMRLEEETVLKSFFDIMLRNHFWRLQHRLTINTLEILCHWGSYQNLNQIVIEEPLS